MRNRKWKFPALLIQGIAAYSLMSCLPVHGASFDIKPVRLDLTSKNPLEKLVINNVSEADFPVQVRAYEWSQNEKGEDVYTETGDIIIFPKILTIKSGEERYIRIGSNVVPGKTEKTYRVYVEEMPSGPPKNDGANVRLYMKVGIPLFIRPPEPEGKVEIQDIAMNDGKLDVKVRNGGNAHFIVTGIHVQGFDEAGGVSFDRNIGGWYLLSGTEKIYSTPVPPDVCGSIQRYDIELKTKETTLMKHLPAAANMCGEIAATAESR